MADEVRFDIGANSQSFEAVYAKMLKDLDALGNKTDEVATKSKKAGDEGASAFDGMGKSALSVLGILGLGGGIAGALSKVIQLTDESRQGMKSLAEESNRAALAFQGLALLQKPGEAGAAINAAVSAGAARSVMPPESAGVFASLQPLAGGPAGAAIAAEQVFKLKELGGASLAGALQVVRGGMAAGMTAEQSATAAFAAAQASGRPVEDIAGATQMAAFFKGLPGGAQGAFEMAAMMPANIPGGEIPAAERQAINLLTFGKGRSATGQAGKWNRLLKNIPGAAEGDWNAAAKWLYDNGYRSPQDLEKAGLGAKEAVFLGSILMDIPAGEARLATMHGMVSTLDLLGTTFAGVATPELLAAHAEEVRSAQFAGGMALLPTPQAAAVVERGRALRKRQQIRLELMMDYGYGAWVSHGTLPEEGELEGPVNRWWWFTNTTGGGYPTGENARISRAPSMVAAEKRLMGTKTDEEYVAVLKEIRDLLKGGQHGTAPAEVRR